MRPTGRSIGRSVEWPACVLFAHSKMHYRTRHARTHARACIQGRGPNGPNIIYSASSMTAVVVLPSKLRRDEGRGIGSTLPEIDIQNLVADNDSTRVSEHERREARQSPFHRRSKQRAGARRELLRDRESSSKSRIGGARIYARAR